MTTFRWNLRPLGPACELVALAMFVVALAATAAKAEPPTTRVAIVAYDSSEAASNLATAMAAGIAGEEGIEVVDRAALDAVMKEQKLASTALVAEASHRRLGELLGADVFVVLETDPVSPAHGAVVVFDGATGVRLADQSIVVTDDSLLERCREAVIAALAKHRLGVAGWRWVSTLPPRNAEWGRAKDGYITALSRLVEQRLLAEPGVVVLERARLGHELAEQRLPTDQAETGQQRSGSVATQLSLIRGEDGGVAASLAVTGMDGQLLTRGRVPLRPGKLGAAGEQLAGLVLDAARLKPVGAPLAIDPHVEARRFAGEAGHLFKQGRWEQAVRASEAAQTLAPGLPAIEYGLMLHQLVCAGKLLRPGRYSHGPLRDVTPQRLAEARRLSLEALELSKTYLGPYGVRLPEPQQPQPAPADLQKLSLFNDTSIGRGCRTELLRAWAAARRGNDRERAAGEEFCREYRSIVERELDELFSPTSGPKRSRMIGSLEPCIREATYYADDSRDLAQVMFSLVDRWDTAVVQGMPDSELPDKQLRQARWRSSRLAPCVRVLTWRSTPFLRWDGIGPSEQGKAGGLSVEERLAPYRPMFERLAASRQPSVALLGEALLLNADEVGDSITDTGQTRRSLVARAADLYAQERAAGVGGSGPQAIADVVLKTFSGCGATLSAACEQVPGRAAAVGEAIKLFERPDDAPLADAGWYSAVISRGDAKLARWAFDRLEAARERGVLEGRLADLHREVLAKHPTWAEAELAGWRKRVLFRVKDWNKRRDDGYGDIWAAAPRDNAIWLVYRAPRHAMDLVRIDPVSGAAEEVASVDVPPTRGEARRLHLSHTAFGEHYAVVARREPHAYIAVLPTNGERGWILDEKTGLAGKELSAVGVIGHTALIATDDPGCLLVCDLKTRKVSVLASASRADKRSELDNSGRFVITGIIPDPERQRFLFVAYPGVFTDHQLHGLWTWKLGEEAPKRLVYLPFRPKAYPAMAPREGGLVLNSSDYSARLRLSDASLTFLRTDPQFQYYYLDRRFDIPDTVCHKPLAIRGGVIQVGEELWGRDGWRRLDLTSDTAGPLPPLDRAYDPTRYASAFALTNHGQSVLVGDKYVLWLLDLGAKDSPAEEPE